MARSLFTPIILLLLIALLAPPATTALPFTPSAAFVQREAEQLRASGLSEDAIATHLRKRQPLPLSSTLSATYKRDTSGDLAPGSVDGPRILGRDALSTTTTQQQATRASILDFIERVLSGDVPADDAEEVVKRRAAAPGADDGFEGMQGLVRRPPRWTFRF